jgi:hypothetical protein
MMMHLPGCAVESTRSKGRDVLEQIPLNDLNLISCREKNSPIPISSPVLQTSPNPNPN